MNVGKLYTINFYSSSPWLVGCAGGGKELALWDMTREDAIQKRFGGRVSGTNGIRDADPVVETEKKEEFAAMMSADSSTTEKESEPSESNLSKDKLGKKKKVHRARG
jgi:hypothetical protein